ncbi:hypothetical protein PVK06_011343 [Gossypium arboreum]|uniref:Uncharacterized protein n=1 Tax=Gossypium arboreum TaxID=29729 RepID=A0ABR0Q8X3_GOSAR|nr:hypothetical protein PVK06_011343 [Gossypium arboreum]
MSIEEEYYINLHVGGKFVRDPHVRYLGGEMVKLTGDLDTISYFELWKIVKIGYEIDTAIFVDDELMLAIACLQFGGNGNEDGEGGEVIGSKYGKSEGEGGGEGEGGEVAENKGGKGVKGQGIEKGGEVVEGLGRESDDVAVSEGHESDGGGEEGVRDKSGSNSEDQNAYLMKAKGEESEGKTSGKNKETILDETESESSREQFEPKVPEEIDGEGLNDSVGREEDGNETEYFDSDDHRSILGSEDDDNTDVCKRRSRFPTYNPNSASPHFYIEMLFKDATIGDHQKMKLMEIQRRVASEMHINVNMIRCRRAKKMVKDKLTGNFVQEFAMLWDYVDELRLKNPGSTIKMAVNRVTPESPSHFKSLLVADLRMEDGFGYTIISDQQKGLEIAINDILPRVEHRNYARHVLSNWSSRKKVKTFEFAFWKVVKSTTEKEWEQNKEDLYKLDEGVAKELFSKNLKA